MTNAIAAANDAVWTLVQATFSGSAFNVLRNPSDTTAPAKKVKPVLYVAQEDGETPAILRVLCGPTYDMKLETRVGFALLGDEPTRRAQQTAAVQALNAALAADRTLGGAVEYAHLDPPERADADQLQWLAGGLVVPVCLLFNAPTPAG